MGTVFFTAAYTAENVRGGLQAIPPGQLEAAKAMGLKNFHITFLIVLPQALRIGDPNDWLGSSFTVQGYHAGGDRRDTAICWGSAMQC